MLARDLAEISADSEIGVLFRELEAIREVLLINPSQEIANGSCDPIDEALRRPWAQTNVSDLRKLNEIVEGSSHAGQIRTAGAGSALSAESVNLFCPPTQIGERLEELMNFASAETLHPVMTAAIAFAEFCDIHPFTDGNGRTAKLWVSILLIQNDYPPFCASRDTPGYLRSLSRFSRTRNVRDLTEVMLRNLIQTGQQLLDDSDRSSSMIEEPTDSGAMSEG